IRPGTQFLDHTPGPDSLNVKFLEFYYSASVKALLVCTPLGMQGLVSGVYVPRVAGATAITNGTFASTLTGWTQSDQSGAVSQWSARGMELTGTGINYA